MNFFKVVVFENPQDLDANSLSIGNTIYTTKSDMGITWKGKKFDNFPTSIPNGSFTLLNLKQGAYSFQMYMCYNKNLIYIRYSSYGSGIGITWSNWSCITPV